MAVIFGNMMGFAPGPSVGPLVGFPKGTSIVPSWSGRHSLWSTLRVTVTSWSCLHWLVICGRHIHVLNQKAVCLINNFVI